MLFCISAQAQKAAIIGVNEDQPDGFAFVAVEDLPAGTRLHYTTEEYNIEKPCAYADVLEEIAFWEAPASGLARGQVVFIHEPVDAADTFIVSCSGGSGDDVCGTFTLVSGNFSIGTQDELTLFEDSDGDPSNGIDVIHSVVYHDHRPLVEGSALLPAANNPSGDSPCGDFTIILKKIADQNDDTGHFEYKGSRALPIYKEWLEDPNNYEIGPDTAFLNVTPFSGVSPAIERNDVDNWMQFYPNPVEIELIIYFDRPLFAKISFEVYDSRGRLFFQKKTADARQDNRLPVASLPAGTYLLRAISGEQVFTARFVKMGKR